MLLGRLGGVDLKISGHTETAKNVLLIAQQSLNKLNISVTYHHANVVLFTSFAFFHSFVNDKIHEWIKTTQYSSHKATSIQPH